MSEIDNGIWKNCVRLLEQYWWGYQPKKKFNESASGQICWLRATIEAVRHQDFPQLLLKGWRQGINHIYFQHLRREKVLINQPIWYPNYLHESQEEKEPLLVYGRKKEKKSMHKIIFDINWMNFYNEKPNQNKFSYKTNLLSKLQENLSKQ